MRFLYNNRLMSFSKVSAYDATRDAANVKYSVDVHPQILTRERRYWYDRTPHAEATQPATNTKSVLTFMIEHSQEAWKRSASIALLRSKPPEERRRVAAMLAFSRFMGSIPLDQLVKRTYVDENDTYNPRPGDAFLIDYDTASPRDAMAIVVGRPVLAELGITLEAPDDSNAFDEWHKADRGDIYVRVRRPFTPSSPLMNNLTKAAGSQVAANAILADSVIIEPHLSIAATRAEPTV